MFHLTDLPVYTSRITSKGTKQHSQEEAVFTVLAERGGVWYLWFASDLVFVWVDSEASLLGVACSLQRVALSDGRFWEALEHHGASL